MQEADPFFLQVLNILRRFRIFFLLVLNCVYLVGETLLRVLRATSYMCTPGVYWKSIYGMVIEQRFAFLIGQVPLGLFAYTQNRVGIFKHDVFHPDSEKFTMHQSLLLIPHTTNPQ